MKLNQIKVTTTSTFEGVTIEEYLEPITAHIVIGMNLFKDFLAGFTDLFGGKSNSYQKVLASMNEEIIYQLRVKAFNLGANCILGLKIDNDEISAKDKSMLMVTAIGTAARASFPENRTESKDLKLETISASDLLVLKKKQELIQAGKKDSLTFNIEYWDFVKTNRISELAEISLDKLICNITSEQIQEETTSFLSSNLQEYLSVLDQDFVINLIYRKILEQTKSKVKLHLHNILVDLNLIDFQRIIAILNDQEFIIRKDAVQFLSVTKPYYDSHDISTIEEIVKKLETKFPERGTRTFKKKLLSSKEKEVWICECGKENDEDKIYCNDCYKDIYGFTEHEFTSKFIIEKLMIELEILKQTLKWN